MKAWPPLRYKAWRFRSSSQQADEGRSLLLNARALHTSSQIVRGGLPTDVNLLDDGRTFTKKIKLGQSERQSMSWSPNRHARSKNICGLCLWKQTLIDLLTDASAQAPRLLSQTTSSCRFSKRDGDRLM